MLFDGSYPPGVEGWMLDEMEREEPPRTCENCMFWEERTCGYICSVLEAGFDDKEIGEMSDEEYMRRFLKDKDDCCKDHEFWED